MRPSVLSKSIFFRLFVLALLLGFSVSLAIPSHAESPRDEGIVDYSGITEVEDFIVKYHDSLNDFLNEKMDVLMSGKGNEKIPKSKNFRNCEQNYTSTWCVSMTMLNEYYRLRTHLIEARNKLAQNLNAAQATARKKLQERLKKEPGRSIEALEKEIAPTYQDLISAVQELDATIDRELEIAQQTLELAVAAYDELHIAWALHTKYLDLIDQLEDYRNAIAEIRDEVELFPFTFFNVQTTQCT